ncbi:hypothetical protein LJC18_02125 [Lachnospiraceae bacterium OttesenSCG-928-E19]|nr:hypothetical protein [Lachnospiraceae bacterium OttesenSCG-928-E19]
MSNKKEFIADDNEYGVLNTPDVAYDFIYAPKYTKIVAKSAGTIFCSPNAIVKTPCYDIRRDNWYLMDGCVRSKTNYETKYPLTNAVDSDDVCVGDEVVESFTAADRNIRRHGHQPGKGSK